VQQLLLVDASVMGASPAAWIVAGSAFTRAFTRSTRIHARTGMWLVSASRLERASA
jgi:hypothetical protein